ncbi:MAG: TetR/AcrR family transcriptional regulator [Cognatishimia sp.]|uniref:TetR/AcrR family transcriptional regulator n=1 Tax=Cognatishimia sp. TaxID=2211648 RepID=UPI003B8D86F8
MPRLIAEKHDTIPALAELFRAKGFEGASINQISKATNLGRGSLYNFFPGGKDDMARAVIGHVHQWFEAEIFTPLHEDLPEVAIPRMFTACQSYFKSGQRICLIGVFALDETRDKFAKQISNYFLRWHDCLTSALMRSGHSEDQATSKATQIIAGIQGAIVLSRAMNDPEVFNATIKQLKALSEKSE